MAIPSSSLPVSPIAPARLRWYAGLLLLALCCSLAVSMHWDDRLRLLVQEAVQSKAERAASVWLPAYEATIDAKALPGMQDDEASDLAYNPFTRTLLAVMGKNPFLVELSLKGEVLRKMPLEGWSNPEGVAVLENGMIAITDERQHTLSIVKLKADTSRLAIADAMTYDLGEMIKKNKGFEGIAWDSQRQQLLLGLERPASIYTWSADSTGLPWGQKQALDIDLDMRNLSALSVDPRTRHVLALSADSHMLLELDEQGRQVSFMSLIGGMNGLKRTIPRAEGVAMDEKGTLYMVSEPNLFYAFKRR